MDAKKLIIAGIALIGTITGLKAYQIKKNLKETEVIDIEPEKIEEK